jgi:hypothetical protein
MQREKRETAIIDFDMELVDRAIAIKDTTDRIHVSTHQPFNGGSHAILGKSAHFKQSSLQLLEVRLKVTRRDFWHIGDYPNRPVT